MEKIPTAGEFKRMHPKYVTNEVSVETLMIEFAKLHVEQALKEASEKATCSEYMEGEYDVNKNSILNSYSLDNIK